MVDTNTNTNNNNKLNIQSLSLFLRSIRNTNIQHNKFVLKCSSLKEMTNNMEF